VALCAIAAAGCGGGGDDGTSTATAAGTNVPTVTSPRLPNAHAPGNRPGGGSTATAPPNGAPAGPPAQRFQTLLAPFRDCLSRHGVDPAQFQQGFQGRPGPRPQQSTPAQMRKQIQAGIACIPALPPRLRAPAERLAKRYEQRNG
jgi:hypothetical protein